jgi:serine/threonine-protein kinase HipA
MTLAEVRLHGARVGILDFDRGGSEFQYTADITDPGRQTLGQIFEDDPRRVRKSHVGVPAWFANLLPEGALRREVVRELGGGNIGDFTLLCRLGADLPGAVTIHADGIPEDDVRDDPNPSPDHPFRHSLAGVQLKFSVASERLSTHVSGNGGWWIAKLTDRSLRDLVGNEFITMRWLASAGFDVPLVDLVPAGSISGIPAGLADPAEMVYLVERFDRTPTGRIHVEDFAQIADVDPKFKYTESGVSYDSMGAVIRTLTGDAGYTEYIRRLVAMLVTGNTDAHLKNWAIRYLDGQTPALSPVYDFHSLTIYQPYRYGTLALALNGERLPSAVSADDFRHLSEHCGVGAELTIAIVNEVLGDLRTAWETLRPEANRRFDALAAHYTERLDTLNICRSS